jgi:sigma-B regulation protein RsbU (phosphoserine phosphatase)
MAVGIQSGVAYHQADVRLNSGDFIVLYTDGVTEAINANEEMFGMGRLEDLLRAHCNENAAEVITAVEKTLAAYTGAVPASDDITIVVVRRS